MSKAGDEGDGAYAFGGLPREWYRSIRRHPSGLLLAAQLLGVLCYPLMESTSLGRAAFGAFGIVVLGLALWVINRSTRVNWIAWVLALAAVGLSALASFGGHAALRPVSHALVALLYLYAAGALIAYMLADRRVTMDELLASGATFTLLAWAWAFAYLACQEWVPGSFIAARDSDAPRTWMELLFLSFTTLSATGLGDVVPVKPMARSLAMLEMFTGVMYIALVVSRLIGMATARPAPR